MTTLKKSFQFAVISLSLLVSLTFAQNTAIGTMNQQANPLLGTWQTTIQLGQGLPPATGIFQARPDGTYREEMYVQNQLAGFWEGQYSLSPDGTLTQQLSNKSPQLCVQGQCMANEGVSTSVSRVSMQTPDAFTVTLQDPASGQTRTLTWQRSATGAAVQTPQTSGPQGGQSPLVGTWHYIDRSPNGHVVTTIFTYTPDGRFDVKTVLNGQSLMSTYGGTYSLSADGTYYETTTEKSPQYCYLQCQANPAQLGTSGPMRVSFSGTNTLTFTDTRGSYTVTRAQAGAAPSGLSNPGAGMAMPGNAVPASGFDGATYPVPSGPADQSAFVGSVIHEQSPWVDPTSGESFTLPTVPTPGESYTSPSGNPLNYNDATGTWTEVDPWGFETEVESGDW